MDGEKGVDVEGGRPTQIPFFKQVFDPAATTPEIEEWNYEGSGTEDDPYVVTWIDQDPRNPMNYSDATKWSLTLLVAMSTLAVAYVSSAYSGGANQIIAEFGCSQEIYTLGISLFVLGFAIGPLVWAPLSELFGRQILFVISYGSMTAFNAGTAGAQNIATLIVLRAIAGAVGSSPLANAGGVIADMFPAKTRGLATALFAACPLAGPILGPIVGGFVGETIGWRWNVGIYAIFTGVVWIFMSLLLPETYAPVLLRKRAAKLSKMTGKVYRTKGDIDQGRTTVGHAFKTSLIRPWILLFKEPIVFLLSIYMAIIYGTLYMLFAAFPIVYQEARGWSPGIGGLAFLGVGLGIMVGIIYSIFENKRYARVSDEHNGFAPPEARLPGAMVGGIALPIGLFWFAWTNYPSIHWMASIAAGAPFGFGLVLVFLSVMNYLIDSYTIYASSVLAANAVIRSLFGTAFPLFTTQMYDRLGIHWASTLVAFLSLMCVPMPFLFYRYGPKIRAKCKFAAEADAFMKKMQGQMQQNNEDDTESTTDVEEEKNADYDRKKEGEEEAEREPVEDESSTGAGFQPINTQQRKANLSRMNSRRSSRSGRSVNESSYAYDHSPYDIDRVNTRESFKYEAGGLSRTSSRKSVSKK